MCFNINSSLLVTIVICLFVVTAFQSAPSGATVPPGELQEPHDFRAYGMDCRSCHKTIGVKKSGGLIKPVKIICHGCHSLEGLLSHPVDMKPTHALPADLPLNEQGLMTCATCHDPHKSYKNPLTGKKTMFLRREGPPKVFCMACHSKS